MLFFMKISLVVFLVFAFPWEDCFVRSQGLGLLGGGLLTLSGTLTLASEGTSSSSSSSHYPTSSSSSSSSQAHHQQAHTASSSQKITSTTTTTSVLTLTSTSGSSTTTQTTAYDSTTNTNLTTTTSSGTTSSGLTPFNSLTTSHTTSTTTKTTSTPLYPQTTTTADTTSTGSFIKDFSSTSLSTDSTTTLSNPFQYTTTTSNTNANTVTTTGDSNIDPVALTTSTTGLISPPLEANVSSLTSHFRFIPQNISIVSHSSPLNISISNTSTVLANVIVPPDAFSDEVYNSSSSLSVTPLTEREILESGENTWGSSWNRNILSTILSIKVSSYEHTTLNNNITLLFWLDDDYRGSHSLCLGFINEESKWVCQDRNLFWADRHSVLGSTPHLTSFAIIVDPSAKHIRKPTAVKFDVIEVSVIALSIVITVTGVLFVVIAISRQRKREISREVDRVVLDNLDYA
eukprot:TRINITY_DN2055_c0_g2_i1.p1 TRINITY_DN2055_c0_g2~~TRINITY_DN2055_c0_g2_i1.p1  ORF type:complete len:459 (-),score=99.48 TRINITY_DN2055_c0_g2_i1:39-1415(-)